MNWAVLTEQRAGMPIRLTLADAQAAATARGGKCLSNEYKNSRTPMSWQCGHCGYVWEANLNNIRNAGKSWCPQCAGNIRFTIETAQLLAESRGGSCLSTEYTNSRTPLIWQCNLDGTVWPADLQHVRYYGTWCPTCAGNTKLTLEVAKQIAKQKGGECLSTEYFNIKERMEWKCGECATVWLASLNSVKNGGSWCPQCGGSAKLSLEDARLAASKNGGTCLSIEYTGIFDPMEWRCGVCSSQWTACLNNVKNRGTWCPNCHLKNESATRKIFETLTGRSFPHKKGLFASNALWDLDGYCEELGIAFEYHGQQHYMFVPHFHRNGIEDLEKQQKRDRQIEIEAIYRDMPICLLVVPYWLSNDERQEFIRHELWLLGVINEAEP